MGKSQVQSQQGVSQKCPINKKGTCSTPKGNEENMSSWRSNLVRPAEVRKHRRYPIQGTLHLLWQDANGRERMSMGKLVDISVMGIRLRADDPIPVRSYLICNDRRLGISGRGTVRHCSFCKGKYEIGIEFSGGTGWHEPVEVAAEVETEPVPAWPVIEPSESPDSAAVLQSHA